MKEALSISPSTEFVAYKAPILSDQQLEIVALLLQGETPASLCRTLNITISVYHEFLYHERSSIFGKYEEHYGGRPQNVINLTSRILVAEPNIQKPLDGTFIPEQIDLPLAAQYSILTLLPFGYTDKEIAVLLNYSEHHIRKLISGRKYYPEALFDWFERVYDTPIFTRAQLTTQLIQRGIVQYKAADHGK